MPIATRTAVDTTIMPSACMASAARVAAPFTTAATMRPLPLSCCKGRMSRHVGIRKVSGASQWRASARHAPARRIGRCPRADQAHGLESIAQTMLPGNRSDSAPARAQAEAARPSAGAWALARQNATPGGREMAGPPGSHGVRDKERPVVRVTASRPPRCLADPARGHLPQSGHIPSTLWSERGWAPLWEALTR